MATGLIDLQPLPSEETVRLHAGHAPVALAEIARVLAAPGPSPVLLLAGPAGGDRTVLLQVAAQRAGGGVSVLPLDLDGYEEGGDLARFAEIQIVKRGELGEATRELLRAATLPLLASVPVSSAGAALVSLLLRMDDPAAVWKELPAATDARPALSALLARQSREGRLILHAVVGDALNDPLRRWLLDESRKNPGLLLALSCSPADVDERVAPRSVRLRLDLQPLPAGDLLEPVQELQHGLDLETADRLQRFLDLAALCGENVPAEILFHHMELEEEERDEILDVIDEDLVETEELRLFIDHQYGHPSFPGLLTYAFVSPRLRHAFLEPVPEAKREQMAGELLEFLNRSVPIHTRGMALLRLSLAGYLHNEDMRRFFQRELRVWIAEGEVADLTAELVDSQIGARDLLGTATQAIGHWPPHYRLAFLDAARRHPEELAAAERVELHNQRAEALRELQRFPEALEEARLALEEARAAHGPEHPTAVRGLNLLGILRREAGNPSEARQPLEQALALHGRDKDDENLASILANLGLVLRETGDGETARGHLERALAIHRQVFGDAHPMVANDLSNLAALEREAGRPERALEYLRPILDIVRNLYGDAHPETGRALTNVAGLLRELGETGAARLHIEAALQIDRQAFGETHPQVVADLNNLAVLERELGDAGAARQHFEQAFAIAQGAFGDDHPLTVQLRQGLSEG
ncbi:MAG TPA: tetratricopeptide repeat protein [Thermoanaerobaculia bacterium]